MDFLRRNCGSWRNQSWVDSFKRTGFLINFKSWPSFDKENKIFQDIDDRGWPTSSSVVKVAMNQRKRYEFEDEIKQTRRESSFENER